MPMSITFTKPSPLTSPGLTVPVEGGVGGRGVIVGVGEGALVDEVAF